MERNLYNYNLMICILIVILPNNFAKSQKYSGNAGICLDAWSLNSAFL